MFRDRSSSTSIGLFFVHSFISATISALLRPLPTLRTIFSLFVFTRECVVHDVIFFKVHEDFCVMLFRFQEYTVFTSTELKSLWFKILRSCAVKSLVITDVVATIRGIFIRFATGFAVMELYGSIEFSNIP